MATTPASPKIHELNLDSMQVRNGSKGLLRKLKSDALGILSKIPFVAEKDESWRYTKPDLFPFSKIEISQPVALQLKDFFSGKNCSDAFTIFQNEEISDVTLINEVLDRNEGGLCSDTVSCLQLALASSLYHIRIEPGCIRKEVIELSCLPLNGALAAPAIVIEIGAGAEIHLIEDLKSVNNMFVFPRLEFVLGDNSNFSFTSIQRLPDSCTYLSRHRLHVGGDVNAEIFHVSSGAKVSRVDLDCRMLKPGSNININSIYIADGNRHIDFHTLQEHIASDCRSNLLSKGILRDASRSVNYGMIEVHERAQRTDAYQKNRNLILSPKARADSIPNLEIRANDVKCSHGASTGQISGEELFYLMTRGISTENSERLLVDGFLLDVLDKARADEKEFLKQAVFSGLNMRWNTL